MKLKKENSHYLSVAEIKNVFGMIESENSDDNYMVLEALKVSERFIEDEFIRNFRVKMLRLQNKLKLGTKEEKKYSKDITGILKRFLNKEVRNRTYKILNKRK